MSLYLWFIFMIVISFCWAVWFIYRPIKDNKIDLNKSNAELGRRKQEELKLDLSNNIIDMPEFEQANIEITQTLAQELVILEETSIVKNKNIYFITIGFILLFLPLISIGVYQLMSPVDVIVSTPNEDQKTQLKSPEKAISEIKLHLLDNPEDYLAWASLASIYVELNNFDDALHSYEKSYQLNSTNPVILSEYASAIYFTNNQQFDQKSLDLLKQALKIDPNLTFALYQIGLYAVSNGDFDLAKISWEKALISMPNSSSDRQFIEELLLQLDKLISEKQYKQSKQNEQNSFSVIVRVSIPENIKSERSEDYLMIYLKPANGRPAPIAIKKIKLGEFSGEVTLTNRDSIMSIEKLSKLVKTIAVARISESGSAIRQEGDIQVQSNIIDIISNNVINLKVLN